MKTFKNVLLFLILGLISAFWIQSCTSKTPSENQKINPPAIKSPQIDYYTCSMHPFIHQDHPGKCPICGMDLVPKYKNSESQPGEKNSSFNLSLEKQQLIGIQSRPTTQEKIHRNFWIPARVARDPDLYVAQQEYLTFLHTSGGLLENQQQNLIQAAKKRLQVMGMSEAQILSLRKENHAEESLLGIMSKARVLIYGSVFESDLAWIHPGDPVEISFPQSSHKILSAVVESIDPQLNPITRTAQIRLYVQDPNSLLKADSYLKIKVTSHSDEVLSIPTNALMEDGNNSFVFIDQGEGKFEPRAVRVGRRGDSNLEILSGLQEGERVVTQANFLLDSEAHLRSVVSENKTHAKGTI